MDEITDAVEGSLSLHAQEWKPGQGFAAPAPTADGAADGDRGEPSSSQAVDVNGTHYFGGAASPSIPASWGDASSPQSDPLDNRAHTRTTLPARRPPRPGHPSLPDEEYHRYRALSLQAAREMDPGDPRHKLVPPTFRRAYCLDPDDRAAPGLHARAITQRRSSFGYPTSLFRVASAADGTLLCLRRMDAVRGVSHRICQLVAQRWRPAGGRPDRAAGGGPAPARAPLDHPGLVRWHQCFLGQRALYFVHGYHAGAATLRERFFDRAHGRGVPLPEALVWSCALQLVSAVRAVHGHDLAVRTLQLNHVLCTQHGDTPAAAAGPYGLPRLRLRINCVGVPDVLEFEARRGPAELQRADLRALGCLLLSLTTGTEVHAHEVYRGTAAPEQERMLAEYWPFVQQHYGEELYALIRCLLGPEPPSGGIRAVAASVAVRAFDELDSAHEAIDEQCAALMGIYESGRALQLLLKLAFVNERPEFGIDKNWSESGDCYILKLFRDFVFHQADGDGRPVMDLGHVVSSLNKLDAADEEKIVLASRDGKNVLVVSFADVAWCLEKAYEELCSSAVPVPAAT